MAISQRPRLTKLLRGDGLPKVHGDYFRPADRIIEQLYQEGVLGDALSEILHTPSIVSGLVVTINANTTRVDVSSGYGLGYDTQVTSIKEHDYTGAELTGVDPLTAKTFPVSASNSELNPIARFIKVPTAQTALLTTGIPNSSTGFVKLRYIDVDAYTRNNPADPSGPRYGFLTQDSFSIVIDNIAPLSTDIVLARLTKDGGGVVTLIETAGYRSQTTALKGDRNVFNIYTGSSVAAYKMVNVVGRDSGTGYAQVAAITALTQTPIGILENAVNGAGRVLTYGPLQVVGFTGTTPGNKVYCDTNGNLTTTVTTLPVGYQMTSGANAWVFFDFGGGGGSGSGSGTAIQIPVNQTAHGFVVGNPIYLNGSVWAKALADDVDSVGVAIVSEVLDVNNFNYTPYGKVALTTGQWDALTGLTGGLVAGTVYRTSSTVAGNLVSVPPAVDNPIIIAISATEVLVQPGFVAAESGAGNTKVETTGTTSGSAGQVINVGYSLEGAAYVDLFIGGSLQPTSKYSVSGTQVTITDAQVPGLEIIVKSTIATTFSSEVSQFIQRKTWTLADEAQVVLNSTTIFPTIASGVYFIHDQDDPTVSARIALRQGTPPDSDVIGYHPLIEGSDLDGYLCLYVSGNDFIIKNRLGSSKTFIIERHI